MADSAEIIKSINQDLFEAQQAPASRLTAHRGAQKLVQMTEKNKKLAGENRRLREEVHSGPGQRAWRGQLAEAEAERDLAQREMLSLKRVDGPPTSSADQLQRKDNFRASMLEKFRQAAAGNPPGGAYVL